jgi:hypothetical protein
MGEPVRNLAEVEHELREIANLSSDLLLRLNHLHQEVAALLIEEKRLPIEEKRLPIEEKRRRED